MAENRIQVTLTARDLLSPELGRIRSNIEAIGGQARISIGLRDLNGLSPSDLARVRSEIASIRGELSNASGGDSGSGGFISSALFGSLGIGAVLAGLALVTQGVQSAIGSVQSAAKLQTTGLAQAGDLASQLGINFGKAKDLVSETRIEISKMAAALPGDNKDYNGIFTQISATVAGNAKGNIEKFKTDAMELTKRFGVLASIRGADADMGGSALNRGLAGTMGLGELYRIDIFQKNPLLQKYVDDQLKVLGKSRDDWQKLTTDTRTSILLTASKKAVSDETVSSFDGTVDSLIQLANTSLFDSDTGMFGFLRKLQEVGGRSGLDAVQGAMTGFFSLMGTISKLADANGLSFDPMAGIIGVIDWFSDLFGTINGVLNGNPLGDITGLFSNLSAGFFDMFGAGVDKLFDAVMSIDFKSLGEQWGFLGGQFFAMIFTRVDWGKISAILIRSILGIGEFIVGMIIGQIKGNLTEWGNAFHRITEAAEKWLDETLGIFTKPLGGAKAIINDPVGSSVNGLVSVATNSVKWGTDWARDHLGKAPTDTAGELIKGATSSITPLDIPKTDRGGTRSSFAPTVNVNGVQGSPHEIAGAVMEHINSAYKKHKENSL